MSDDKYRIGAVTQEDLDNLARRLSAAIDRGDVWRSCCGHEEKLRRKADKSADSAWGWFFVAMLTMFVLFATSFVLFCNQVGDHAHEKQRIIDVADQRVRAAEGLVEEAEMHELEAFRRCDRPIPTSVLMRERESR